MFVNASTIQEYLIPDDSKVKKKEALYERIPIYYGYISCYTTLRMPSTSQWATCFTILVYVLCYMEVTNKQHLFLVLTKINYGWVHHQS